MSLRLSGFAGPIFGGTMLALISGQDAAAQNEACKNVDFARVPDIKAALALCLKGDAQPADLKLLTTPREMGPVSCEQERDRDEERKTNSNTKLFKTACSFKIPADTSCPADVDGKSRVGNRFPSEYLLEDRAVGTTRCTFTFKGKDFNALKF